MTQISNKIFCDEFVASLKYEKLILGSPYADLPYMLVENFLSDEVCDEIDLYVKHSLDTRDAKLISDQKSSNEKIRKTKIFKLSDDHLNIYNNALSEHKKDIENFFNVAFSKASAPQVLSYTKGFYYKKHSDDSSELIDKNKKTIGFKQVREDRKITTLLFINTYNDSFSGGELKFNYLKDENSDDVVLKPKKGTLLIFPSNPIFSHEVLEVLSGQRVSIAQWHNIL